MSAGPNLDVPKLTEQEMQQLQVLLYRYLAHKTAGFSDIVTEKLVNKCQSMPMLEPPAAEPSAPPAANGTRRGKAAQAPAS